MLRKEKKEKLINLIFIMKNLVILIVIILNFNIKFIIYIIV